MFGRRSVVTAMAVLAMAAAAQGQQQSTYVIAVAVDSSDGRVRQWAPELRKEAADVVQKAARNARAIIVTGFKREAAEQAKRNSADYLLWIEVSPRPTAEVQIRGVPAQTRDIYGEPRANEGDILVSWTVEPLHGQKLRLHDVRTVHPAEYPGGPRFDWLQAIASRSVRDAAAAAVGTMKKKKGL